ncbi:SpoIIE family protein phosphatase [Paludibacterium paludis]|uniref:CBS domain-containing protein n=1 Tax=Paludibacterium paludis TaxID=1225769 RepID=A0A918U7J5_9NEIS|nr:SpoIIE family protein phosphatase [Paludibacterium paludis]GGY03468.1 hypothetical protein GCM10011289_02210 [Paludibacterium paludis]
MRPTPLSAGDLLQVAPSVEPDCTNREVLELFGRHKALPCLPVIERGIPIGMINRNLFVSQMAKPFHREVFGRKSCIAFMDKNPLVVDADTSLTDLSYLAVESGEKALNDGFIVTRDTQYCGIGSATDLMRAITDQTTSKNRQMMESIHYASVIQTSFLRQSAREMRAALDDHVMIWEPRDVVGGDYYYFRRQENGFFAAVIDCTGHGVPGAFMTLIMASALDQVLTSSRLDDPAALLSRVNRQVKQSLGQYAPADRSVIRGAGSDDGMDAAFMHVDLAARRLTFAGANTPLFLHHPGDEAILTLAGNRMGVAYVDTPEDYRWDNHSVALAPGSSVWASSDGIIDQIGSERGIAFGKRRMKEVLLDHIDAPLEEQGRQLMHSLSRWQAAGNQRRRDDVSFMGFRLPRATPPEH